MRDESSIYNKPGDVSAILAEALRNEMVDTRRDDEPMMPLLDVTYPGVDFGPKTTYGPPYSRADFRRAFNAIADGTRIEVQCEMDKTLPPLAQFRRYVKRDPVLKAEMQEAEELLAEHLAGLARRAAEGVDEYGNPIIEDTPRSALKVNTYFKLAAIYNRDKYGERKQVDVNNTIRVDTAHRTAMDNARKRVEKIIEGETIRPALPAPSQA